MCELRLAHGMLNMFRNTDCVLKFPYVELFDAAGTMNGADFQRGAVAVFP